MATRFYGFLALLFGLAGGVAVLMLAAARHLPLDGHAKELLAIAANGQITHSLLGLLAIFFRKSLGGLGKLSAALCAIGMALFTIPVTLLGFGLLAHTPSAPFGGIAFALAWVSIGIGAFKYSLSTGKSHDIA